MGWLGGQWRCGCWGGGDLGGAALNHEDVVKVGKLGILPRYICGFGV